jgi:hypothetical protein
MSLVYELRDKNLRIDFKTKVWNAITMCDNCKFDLCICDEIQKFMEENEELMNDLKRLEDETDNK